MIPQSHSLRLNKSNDGSSDYDTNLLVSIRSYPEAMLASAAGADLLDLKEPNNGSLGKMDDTLIQAIIESMAGKLPVSVAMGELIDFNIDPRMVFHSGIRYLKWGLSATQGIDWQSKWQGIRDLLPETTEMVLVGYSDWDHCQSVSLKEIIDFALQEKPPVVLIDTYSKDGHSLLDDLSLHKIRDLLEKLHSCGIALALAGSLTLKDIHSLAPLRPDWLALRGAVCQNGDRKAALDFGRIQQIKKFLFESQSR